MMSVESLKKLPLNEWLNLNKDLIHRKTFLLPMVSLQHQCHTSSKAVLPLVPCHRAPLIASALSEVGGCHVLQKRTCP